MPAMRTTKKASNTRHAEYTSRAGGPGTRIGAGRQAPRTMINSGADTESEGPDGSHIRKMSQRPKPGPVRKRVYFHKNGLISMKTPKDMAEVTKTNRKESPLLRLPTELRNKVFKDVLTTANAEIGITNSYERPIAAVPFGWQEFPCVEKGVLQTLGHCMPRICRQIYSETATMLYAENTFVFNDYKYMVMRIKARLPAQLEAVQFVKLDSGEFDLSHDQRDAIYDDVVRPLVNLKVLTVEDAGPWISTLQQTVRANRQDAW